jgi:hypothetical protein
MKNKNMSKERIISYIYLYMYIRHRVNENKNAGFNSYRKRFCRNVQSSLHAILTLYQILLNV